MNRIAVVAPLLLLAACASAEYDKPYSEIWVDKQLKADYLVIPVTINRVDDRNVQYYDHAVVAPGQHKVTIDVPPRKGFHMATQHDFAMATDPCTRYYIAAKLENLATQDWTPFVTTSEPIGECAKRYAGAR